MLSTNKLGLRVGKVDKLYENRQILICTVICIMIFGLTQIIILYY